MIDSDQLLVERDGGVLILTINTPPMNRMTFEFMDEFERCVTAAAADDSVRCLLITACGEENFSVGMDLKQLASVAADLSRVAAVLDQRLRVLALIENMAKPSVVTMYGHCLGGGLELPLACHFRLAAAEGARIGLPELDLGTVPAWGGTARLTRRVGRDRALDMILRARKIDGPEALRIGLVHEVHPLVRLKPAARELAQQLASMPPIAVAGVLACVVGAGESSLDAALVAERRAFLRCAGSEDQAEGLRAFIEKRKPVFRGR
ncbi:MAG TPA: enoyl-CoA hydratase-related protein [Steroidobacteraceae bacterium]|nr:enoyl-CoA hydratase-related protein [Steroidobacteraceae bacterium]HQR48491.1 enoyl-CoA hydratase-related protein [Steroidobacteraceae bacterium]